MSLHCNRRTQLLLLTGLILLVLLVAFLAGRLSNNSNGAPKTLRPIMDATLVAMAMMQGLTSAIVNPCDLRLMETIKTCDIIKNHVLYSDSYLEL